MVPQARCGSRSRAIRVLAAARNALVVAAATLVAYIIHLAQGSDFTATHPFTLIGHMPGGLPAPAVPTFTWDLLPSACVVALVGFLESFSIAQAFGQRQGYSVEANQELVALGAANTLSSFFRAYPITGSFSRTSVNANSGVQTQLGGLFTGLIVLAALQWATPAFYYVPKPALAVVIIAAALRVLDWRQPLLLWRRDRTDLLVAAVSFTLCLFVGSMQGILTAAGLAVLVVLFYAARPAFHVMRAGEVVDVRADPEAPSTAHSAVREARVALKRHKSRRQQMLDWPSAWSRLASPLQPGTVLVRPDGPLIAACATAFKDVVEAELEAGEAIPRAHARVPNSRSSRSSGELFGGGLRTRTLHLVLDFTCVSWIDSAGIAALSTVAEFARACNADDPPAIWIANAPNKVVSQLHRCSQLRAAYPRYRCRTTLHDALDAVSRSLALRRLPSRGTSVASSSERQRIRSMSRDEAEAAKMEGLEGVLRAGIV